MAATARYFAGVLNLGEQPDYEQVARTIDLMRASGVPVEPLPAVVRDGTTKLPFLAKGRTVPSPLDNELRDPRGDIERLSRWHLDAYANVDPRKAGADTLDALVRLERESDGREGNVRPADLRPRPEPCRNLERVFEGLVGLDRQQAVLRKVGTLAAKHGREAVGCLHMAFLGAPGTGKTELARRLLSYYEALGVAGGGSFVKVSAADLVGRYVGTSAARTRSALDRARGGLLFVDEAYALMDSSSYGQEAIDTLVDGLEDRRDELVCVFAGYPDEMEQLFARNPGLRDRFAFRVAFDDYTPAELAQIFRLLAQARGFSVDDGALKAAKRLLGQLRGTRGFANARTARRLMERCLLEAAQARDEALICAPDVEAAYAEPDLGGDARSARIGFTA